MVKYKIEAFFSNGIMHTFYFYDVNSAEDFAEELKKDNVNALMERIQ